MEPFSESPDIDVTLNGRALTLIKHIRLNVIHGASTCHFAHTSSAFYWDTMTICNPTTEKNDPVVWTLKMIMTNCINAILLGMQGCRRFTGRSGSAGSSAKPFLETGLLFC